MSLSTRDLRSGLRITWTSMVRTRPDSCRGLYSCRRFSHQPLLPNLPRRDDPDWYLHHRHNGQSFDAIRIYSAHTPFRTPSLVVKRSPFSVLPVSPITISLPRFVDKLVWSSDLDLARVFTMDTRTISPSSLLPWVSTWRLLDSSSKTLKRVVLFPTRLYSSTWLRTLRQLLLP